MYRFLVAALLLFCGSSPIAFSLDEDNSSKPNVSMDEIARQIRQFQTWQILDASTQKKKSGSPYFRFKLLGTDGKVKVINIDPNNPDLKLLE